MGSFFRTLFLWSVLLTTALSSNTSDDSSPAEEGAAYSLDDLLVSSDIGNVDTTSDATEQTGSSSTDANTTPPPAGRPSLPRTQTIPLKLPDGPYWCTYANGAIAVGAGETVGQNVLASWQTDAYPFGVDVTQCELVSSGPTAPTHVSSATYTFPQGPDKATTQAQTESAAPQKTPLSEEAVRALAREEKFGLTMNSLAQSGVDVREGGMACTGKLQLWGDRFVDLTMSVSKDGIYGRGYITELAFGPLKITGCGPDGRYGTADDGVLTELSIGDHYFYLLCSGRLELFGLVGQADISITNGGISLYALASLFGMFNLTIMARTAWTPEIPEFTILALFENNLISFLKDTVKKAMTEGISNAVTAMKSAQGDLDTLQNTALTVLEREHANMLAERDALARELQARFEECRKKYEPLKAAYRETEKKLEVLVDQINAIRAELQKERNDAIASIGKMQEKVHSLYEEIERQRAIVRAERKIAKDALDKAQRDVDTLQKTIDENRAAVQAERKKADDALNDAKKKVESIQGEIDRTVNERRAAEKESWIHTSTDFGLLGTLNVDIPNPGPMAKVAGLAIKEAALQAGYAIAKGVLDGAQKTVASLPVDMDPRVGPVIAAKTVATGVLDGAKGAVAVFPIDADPRVAGIFVAYEPAHQALIGAAELLAKIPIDSDPRLYPLFIQYYGGKGAFALAYELLDGFAIVEAGADAFPQAAHIAVIEAALLANEAAQIGVKASISALKGGLYVAEKTTDTVGRACGQAIAAVAEQIANGLEFFNITKAGISIDTRDLVAGKLPMIFVQLMILKQEKNFSFQGDLSNPKTFVDALVRAITTFFTSDGGDDSFLKKAEELKKQIEDERAAAAKERKAKEDAARERALAKEHAAAIGAADVVRARLKAEAEKVPSVTKGEGEFGKAPAPVAPPPQAEKSPEV